MHDLFMLWFVFGVLTSLLMGFALWADADDQRRSYGNRWTNSTPNARVAFGMIGGLVIGATWPIGVVVLIAYGTYRTLAVLALGTRDLYRLFFPKKADLPKAQVHR